MSLTWIEVADTAVKIGLGALITGVSAYVLAGRSHNQTLSRELASRKIKILEDACAEAEIYFSYCTHFYNTVGGLAHDNETERDQTELEKIIVAKLHETFAEALESRNRARAKVSLLGATNALEHLTSFNAVLTEYRLVLTRKGKMLTSQQHYAATANFRHHKQAFYRAAGVFLEKLGSGKGT